MVNKTSILKQFVAMKKKSLVARKNLIEEELQHASSDDYRNDRRRNELQQIDGAFEVIYEMDNLVDDLAD